MHICGIHHLVNHLVEIDAYFECHLATDPILSDILWLNLNMIQQMKMHNCEFGVEDGVVVAPIQSWRSGWYFLLDLKDGVIVHLFSTNHMILWPPWVSAHVLKTWYDTVDPFQYLVKYFDQLVQLGPRRCGKNIEKQLSGMGNLIIQELICWFDTRVFVQNNMLVTFNYDIFNGYGCRTIFISTKFTRMLTKQIASNV